MLRKQQEEKARLQDRWPVLLSASAKMRIPIHSESPDNDVVLAAGGVIERPAADGIEIAIIRRERYGSEWCLPKGKVDAGELLTETAHREIREETGCEVELVRFLTTETYPTQHHVKAVFYWLCRLKGECRFSPNEEVRELLWLSPEAAIARLSHQGQRDIVRETYLSGKSDPPAFFRKPAFYYSRYVRGKHWKRLDSKLTAYRAELPARLASIDASNTEWEVAIRHLLDLAEAALMEGDIDRGWKCFLAAARVELLPIRDRALLKAKAEQIRIESGKLNRWRNEAVNSLLPVNVQASDLSPNRLFDAAALRDEHYTNQAYKQGLRRAYHMVLAILLVLDLLVLFLLLDVGKIRFDIDPSRDYFNMVVGVAAFGLLGAIFSAILKGIDIDDSARIPETALAIRVTFLRVLLGVSSAVILYFILISDLASLLNKNLADTIKALEPTSIYALSIAAGVSERLVLNALSKFNKA